jgi:hypothetical protein
MTTGDQMRHVTIIDRPGEYLTRKGECVRIVNGMDGVWSGWILRTASDGRTHKQWSEWPSVAVFEDAPAFDIVAYVGA